MKEKWTRAVASCIAMYKCSEGLGQQILSYASLGGPGQGTKNQQDKNTFLATFQMSSHGTELCFAARILQSQKFLSSKVCCTLLLMALARYQGCQMVYFKTKSPNLGKFLGSCNGRR
jgi:hypothetical protein